jgi:YgiT-type zinc finger domain-containing protein
MNAKCVQCGGTVTDSTTTDDYRGGRNHVVLVENVPCGVCQSCGELYFDASVVRRIEMLAQPLIRGAALSSGKPLAVVDYGDGSVSGPVPVPRAGLVPA